MQQSGTLTTFSAEDDVEEFVDAVIEVINFAEALEDHEFFFKFEYTMQPKYPPNYPLSGSAPLSDEDDIRIDVGTAYDDRDYEYVICDDYDDTFEPLSDEDVPAYADIISDEDGWVEILPGIKVRYNG